MRTPKIVQAPEGCCSYLTAGKKYGTIEALNSDGRFGCFFSIVDDRGDRLACLEKESGHLNGNDWIVVEWNEDEPTQNVNAQDPQDEAERVREAAPELLEALQALYKSFEHTEGNDRGNASKTNAIMFNSDVKEALTKARKAIHKATQP